MTKHVYITVTGCCRDESLSSHSQSLPEIDETVTAPGEFYQREDGFYILYDEPAEGSGGQQRTNVKNIVRLRNSVLELTKKGGINARMIFEPGRHHRTDYITPWGTLLLETETRYLNVNRTKDKIHIEAEYVLSADGSAISTRFISIIIQKSIQ